MIEKKEIYYCKSCWREIDVEDILVENECPYCGSSIKSIKEINMEDIK